MKTRSISRSVNTPLAFLYAGLVMVAAYACMADPDPGGGHRPATATEAAECGPADGPLCDLHPEGAHGLAADTKCPEDSDDLPLPDWCPTLNDTLNASGKSCPKWGMEKDGNGGCRCRNGLVLGSDGGCNDPNWKKPGLKGGGGGGGGGGRGGGGGGRGGNNGSDDDDGTFGVSLLCTPEKAKRGGWVDCNATVRNAEGQVTYTWQLKPENGGVQVWPSGDPEKLPFVADTSETASWSGTVAAGGQVSVLAIDSLLSDDGTPSDSIPPRSDFAHSTFTVVDRGWRIDRTIVRHGFTRSTDTLKGYLGGGGYAGMNVNSHDSGAFDSIFEGQGDVQLHGIGIGPNTGYQFIPFNPYYVDRRWTLNERLDSAGPEELPDVLHGDTVNLWTYMERRHKRGWRNWIHPRDYRAGVIRHERYGRDTLKGHQGQIEKAIAWETCGDGSMLADRMVAAGAARAEALLDSIHLAADATYRQAAGHHNVRGHFRAKVPRWIPGMKDPKDTLDKDTRPPDTVPPITGCDWSIF